MKYAPLKNLEDTIKALNSLKVLLMNEYACKSPDAEPTLYSRLLSLGLSSKLIIDIPPKPINYAHAHSKDLIPPKRDAKKIPPELTFKHNQEKEEKDQDSDDKVFYENISPELYIQWRNEGKAPDAGNEVFEYLSQMPDTENNPLRKKLG